MNDQPTTTRIREDVARCTLGFLIQAKSRLDAAFAGLISRSTLEPAPLIRGQCPHGFHVVDWKAFGITPQQVVDELLRLKEKEGDSITSHDRTLSFALMMWDGMIWNGANTEKQG